MVVYASLTPRLELPYDFKYADKLYHVSGYLWLSVLPAFAFRRPGTALGGTLAMIPLGVCLEFAQRYVPGRSFSLGDMVANCMGVVLGMWLARHMERSRWGSNFRASAE